MRIVYMGTPAFACAPLEQLYNSQHEIVAVVTGPDKPSGRGKKLMPTAVSMTAEKLGLNILKPVSLKDESFYETIKNINHDLIVVIAFRILPEKLFSLPKQGAINIHGSLLPKYRGAAPINWALINGDKETGLSAFYLKKKVDTGDIISKVKISIGNNDNFDSLYEKLSEKAGQFLLDTIDLIKNEQSQPLKQDDLQASAAPKISPFDALIDFGFPAENVRNFIRGMSTKPGAYTFFRGKKLKILTCQFSDQIVNPNTRPGTIINNKKKLIIQCAKSAIEISSVIPEGKKMMDGASFINGSKPELEEVLGEIPKECEIEE